MPKQIDLKKNLKDWGVIFKYSESLKAYILEITDPNTVFPLYIHDEAGLYRIMRTKVCVNLTPSSQADQSVA